MIELKAGRLYDRIDVPSLAGQTVLLHGACGWPLHELRDRLLEFGPPTLLRVGLPWDPRNQDFPLWGWPESRLGASTVREWLSGGGRWAVEFVVDP